MENDALHQSFQRTEEVRDIIDRMPHRTGRIVALLVCGLALLLLLSGWIIEYPETVSGPVSILSRQAPVRLVANVSGKLHLLKSNGHNLMANDVIAIMDNPAKLGDIQNVDRFLLCNLVDSLVENPRGSELPNVNTLGELSSVYYSFRDALEKWEQYLKTQPYQKKAASLVTQLNSEIQLSNHNREQMETRRRSLAISKRNMRRDSALFRSAAIAELDLEKSAVSYLSLLENTQAMNKEEASYQYQIKDSRHKLKLLEVEKQETEQKLKMNLIAGYNELVNALRLWKQKYLFVSPVEGTLENLNFWRENDFVQAGTEAFSVLPAGRSMVGQVFLPSIGAGKVAVGQKVIIKLENYPYIEYGSINGTVSSISKLTNQAEPLTRQNNMHTYLVTVDLPKDLTTNYGATLDFRYEVRGVADIVTKPRKLIERLFDNLKYIASKK